MRPIDADALRETIEYCHYFGDDGTTFNASEKEALMQIIDDAPTIDAVEVVRCKDCKYAEVYDGYYTQVCCENGVIGGHGELWNPDDFCSCGERETDHE